MLIHRRLGQMIATAASAAGLVGALASGPAAATPAPSSTGAWAAGIAHPATPHCPAGTSALVPNGASRTAHGGTKYTFEVAGHEGFEIVPPAGFNPSSASNAELQEMNLPTRPASAGALASWSKSMASYKGVSTPAFCQGAPVTRTQKVPTDARAAHTSDTGWAGYINTGRTYDQVVSHWTQNYAHTCNCAGPTDEVTWVGLGGVNGGLIQAGTRLYSNTTPYAWWEYVGPNDNGGVSIQQMGNVAAGDDIAALVNWSPDHMTADFELTDNGTYLINFGMVLGSYYYDGSTAEFINERPAYCYGGCYKTLSNFVRTNFTQARVYLSGSTTAYPFTAEPYEGAVATSDGNFYAPPCSTSSNLLMYPENASGENFDLVWCRAS